MEKDENHNKERETKERKARDEEQVILTLRKLRAAKLRKRMREVEKNMRRENFVEDKGGKEAVDHDQGEDDEDEDKVRHSSKRKNEKRDPNQYL